MNVFRTPATSTPARACEHTRVRAFFVFWSDSCQQTELDRGWEGGGMEVEKEKVEEKEGNGRGAQREQNPH